MKNWRTAIIFITVALPFLFTSCISDPGVWFSVDNQTDQELDIFINKLHDADISPREESIFSTTSILPKNIYPADKKFLIEAKTDSGEVVYSREFTWQELDDMNWTIVIPP